LRQSWHLLHFRASVLLKQLDFWEVVFYESKMIFFEIKIHLLICRTETSYTPLNQWSRKLTECKMIFHYSQRFFEKFLKPFENFFVWNDFDWFYHIWVSSFVKMRNELNSNDIFTINNEYIAKIWNISNDFDWFYHIWVSLFISLLSSWKFESPPWLCLPSILLIMKQTQ
jgi:hypothetical protein